MKVKFHHNLLAIFRNKDYIWCWETWIGRRIREANSNNNFIENQNHRTKPNLGQDNILIPWMTYIVSSRTGQRVRPVEPWAKVARSVYERNQLVKRRLNTSLSDWTWKVTQEQSTPVSAGAPDSCSWGRFKRKSISQSLHHGMQRPLLHSRPTQTLAVLLDGSVSSLSKLCHCSAPCLGTWEPKTPLGMSTELQYLWRQPSLQSQHKLPPC